MSLKFAATKYIQTFPREVHQDNSNKCKTPFFLPIDPKIRCIVIELTENGACKRRQDMGNAKTRVPEKIKDKSRKERTLNRNWKVH